MTDKRISGRSFQSRYEYRFSGSLVDLFKFVIAFQWTFDAKRVVRECRDLGGELYA
jgi:hypothetical protein